MVVKDDNWCQNLLNLRVHFPDLIPNFYYNLNNNKLDLNVSSPKGQLISVQIIRAFSFSLQIRVITSFFEVFCSVFYKGHSPGHLQKWNILHVS